MTKEELAAIITGRHEGNELTLTEESQADQNGLVVIFGYSDDNVELRGAVEDEFGAYDGTTLYFNREGLLRNECDDNDCPYFEKAKQGAKTIEAKPDYSGNGEYMWTYETTIPHACFDVLEADEIGEGKFCRGIVFSMADLV